MRAARTSSRSNRSAFRSASAACAPSAREDLDVLVGPGPRLRRRGGQSSEKAAAVDEGDEQVAAYRQNAREPVGPVAVREALDVIAYERMAARQDLFHGAIARRNPGQAPGGPGGEPGAGHDLEGARPVDPQDHVLRPGKFCRCVHDDSIQIRPIERRRQPLRDAQERPVPGCRRRARVLTLRRESPSPRRDPDRSPTLTEYLLLPRARRETDIRRCPGAAAQGTGARRRKYQSRVVR